jgi:hypothetical protein
VRDFCGGLPGCGVGHSYGQRTHNSKIGLSESRQAKLRPYLKGHRRGCPQALSLSATPNDQMKVVPTVQRHVADDPAFAEALLREGIDTARRLIAAI